LRTANALVVHSDDCGEFYCEHAFFLAQQVAAEPGAAICKNDDDDALVGFLHVPRDEATDLPLPTLDHDQRHRGTREIVGIALRGYFDDVTRSDPTLACVRVLLTGYLRWGAVQNNPSGDFVGHADNVDAAVELGFGSSLQSGKAGRYRVRSAAGGLRDLEILAVTLPVDDDAFDGGPRSLQGVMRSFLPHAVLSLGVHKGGVWLAEHHADDGGLGDRDGRPVHEKGAPARTVMPNNFSLVRALELNAGPRGARDPSS
jgi:hypothetical protein